MSLALPMTMTRVPGSQTLASSSRPVRMSVCSFGLQHDDVRRRRLVVGLDGGLDAAHVHREMWALARRRSSAAARAAVAVALRHAECLHRHARRRRDVIVGMRRRVFRLIFVLCPACGSSFACIAQFGFFGFGIDGRGRHRPCGICRTRCRAAWCRRGFRGAAARGRPDCRPWRRGCAASRSRNCSTACSRCRRDCRCSGRDRRATGRKDRPRP